MDELVVVLKDIQKDLHIIASNVQDKNVTVSFDQESFSEAMMYKTVHQLAEGSFGLKNRIDAMKQKEDEIYEGVASLHVSTHDNF